MVLMIAGSCLAILELTKGKPVDFDTGTLIYMFTEPTITGIIIINDFAKKQKQFLKSIRLLNTVELGFHKLGIKRTCPIMVKWMIRYYYSAIIIGNFSYNLFSYIAGKSATHSVYEYLSYGISFHVQNTIITYYLTFAALLLQNFIAINKRLETIKRPVSDVKRMVEELKLLGEMHFCLCKSLQNINEVCAKTVFLYSMRAFIEICAWLLSLNGLLPKLRVDFTMMIVCYTMTLSFNAMLNEAVKNWVRYRLTYSIARKVSFAMINNDFYNKLMC